MIRRSAYDVLYDNDWNRRKSVELYGGQSDSFEELMQFAQFMSKGLGSRLKVSFPYKNAYTVKFEKVG